MDFYHEGNRQLQDRFDSRRLADRLEQLIVSDRFDDNAKAFIEARDMFFLATADADGRPDCSYKGGDPGFVRVVDEHTLAFPIYDGNGMFRSAGNALVNPAVGMLFIDFEHQWRVRVNGDAVVEPAVDDALRDHWPEAQIVVRVRARQVFQNCPRYIHKMQLVERSQFVPRAACATPVPDWKRMPIFEDVLPQSPPPG